MNKPKAKRKKKKSVADPADNERLRTADRAYFDLRRLYSDAPPCIAGMDNDCRILLYKMLSDTAKALQAVLEQDGVAGVIPNLPTDRVAIPTSSENTES